MYKGINSLSCGGQYCRLESPGIGINPVGMENTYPAGAARSGGCEGFGGEAASECLLASAYIPAQIYRAGFCPGEALCKGTLFPELVRPWRQEDSLWN